MSSEKMFVLKKMWKISIASLHRLTQDMQRANLICTSGDLTKLFLISTVNILALLLSELYLNGQSPIQ